MFCMLPLKGIEKWKRGKNKNVKTVIIEWKIQSAMLWAAVEVKNQRSLIYSSTVETLESRGKKIQVSIGSLTE